MFREITQSANLKSQKYSSKVKNHLSLDGRGWVKVRLNTTHLNPLPHRGEEIYALYAI